MSKNFSWLLYWKLRQHECNPEINVPIQLKTTSINDWQLEINFEDSPQKFDVNFDTYLSVSSSEYLALSVKSGRVLSTCSNLRMLDMVQLFREVLEHTSDLNHIVERLDIDDKFLKDLINWQHTCRNADGDIISKVLIESIDPFNWRLQIFSETIISEEHFVKKLNSELDYYEYQIQKGMFTGTAGPLNLPELISEFLKLLT